LNLSVKNKFVMQFHRFHQRHKLN